MADPTNYPWTIGALPNSQTEGALYAKYILDNLPTGKIAVLFQHDESGKDLLVGFKEGSRRQGLDDRRGGVLRNITANGGFRGVQLKASGADILLMFSPQFAAQAIRKSAEINWK